MPDESSSCALSEDLLNLPARVQDSFKEAPGVAESRRSDVAVYPRSLLSAQVLIAAATKETNKTAAIWLPAPTYRVRHLHRVTLDDVGRMAGKCVFVRVCACEKCLVCVANGPRSGSLISGHALRIRRRDGTRVPLPNAPTSAPSRAPVEKETEMKGSRGGSVRDPAERALQEIRTPLICV